MFAGWTASVEQSGVAAFAHSQAATVRAEVQARLAALSRPTNLRYVDDQAIAALAATLNVIGDRPVAEFRDHAIVAGSRALGKNMLAASMEKNDTEGAWGVSPQIIPNGSLHSVSGLLSVALGMTGPNIGAGGVHGCEGEAFVGALSMLNDGMAKHAWVVLTGVDDEAVRAVALALQKSASQHKGVALRYDTATHNALTLETLFDAVQSAATNQRWSLPGGLSLSWCESVLAEAAA